MTDQPDPYIQEKQPLPGDNPPPQMAPGDNPSPQMATVGAPPPQMVPGGAPPPQMVPGGVPAPSYPGQQQPYPVMGQQYGQPYQTGTVIVQQPTVTRVKYEASPMTLTCPSCNATITTRTKKKVGILVWVASGIICLVGCLFLGITWFGCCLIPFCIPDLYDVEHQCPNCDTTIGQCKRLS